MGPAVLVQDRRGRVRAEPARAGLVRDAGHRDLVLEVRVVRQQVPVMHPEVGEHLLELVEQPPLGLLVAGRVAELDVAVARERDAVLGQRQVLGRQPEVDGVAGDVAQRPRRREPRLAGLLAAEHRRLRLADHLDVAQRVLVVRAREVEVVDPERLLEHGRVLFLGQREHGLAVVEHVVAADLVGAVGQPARVLVGGRREQQLGAVRGAAGHDHDVALEGLGVVAEVDDDARDRRARVVGHEPLRAWRW